MKDLLVDSTIDNAIDEINRTTDKIDKLRELNHELVGALKELKERLEDVVYSEFSTHNNKEPWKKFKEWHKAEKLIAKNEANNE